MQVFSRQIHLATKQCKTSTKHVAAADGLCELASVSTVQRAKTLSQFNQTGCTLKAKTRRRWIIPHVGVCAVVLPALLPVEMHTHLYPSACGGGERPFLCLCGRRESLVERERERNNERETSPTCAVEDGCP